MTVRDFVADFDVHVADDAGAGRRDFHRRFVGFEFDQRSVRVDGVAGFDEDRDDGDVVETADVGDGQGDDFVAGLW
jgi:hypothetical protein